MILKPSQRKRTKEYRQRSVAPMPLRDLAFLALGMIIGAVLQCILG